MAEFQGFPESVSQSVQFLDPYTKEQTVQLMQDARRAAANRINIPTQEVAGFNPDQEAAFGAARSGLGSFRPYLDDAAGLYGDAAGQYGSQIGGIEEGLDLTRRGIDPTASGLAAIEGLKTGSQAYRNPYQQDVIDTTMAEINRQSDIEAQSIGRAAANAGAFGGARHGILEAEHLRNTADKRNQILAQLNNQNYNQAQGMGLQAAQGYNQAGTQYGQIGGQVANLASGYGNVAQGQANLGQGLGALGQLGTSLNTQDVSLLSTTGGVQRASEQAELDAAYQATLQKEYEPYQRVSFVSDILRGTPSGGQTLSVASAPLPNPFTQSLGAGLATQGLFAPKKGS
jgi:hypothetical protein